MCQHCKDRRSLIHDLEEGLVSANPSAQEAFKKIEEFREHVSEAGKPFAERLDLAKSHYLFGMQKEPLAVDAVKLLMSNGELGKCYSVEKGELNLSLRTGSMKRYIIRELRMKTLPGWIAIVAIPIRTIDISGNPNLSSLPLDELCSMRDSLKEMNCQNCIRLQLPPPEIAGQGGEASFMYMQSVKTDSETNKRMNLILIGNGEAGKTSVFRALSSVENKAGKIDVDKRTIGIDLDRWEPDGADGLTFDVMDFGGQEVYGKTNQYFIVRRALYLLVWNVRTTRDEMSAGGAAGSMKELRAMISTWLRTLQARVPGASVMLVATHIDIAGQSEIEDQSEEVRKCVQEELKKMSEEEDENILPLHVIREGGSFRVNCLEGEGIKELRASVCQAAKELLWWNESIPRPYLKLRHAVEVQSKNEPYLKVEQYLKMLKEAEVEEKEEKIVTSFLHDMGVLKYFGRELKAMHSREAESKYSVEDTVFIDIEWMIDVFKGVMRHDWRHLLDFFHQDPTKSKKTKKLLHLGIIDEDMFEYLWPQPNSKFWSEEKSGKSCRSAEIGFTKSHVEVEQAVALLQGCDLAHFLGAGEMVDAENEETKRELLCPGIIPSFTHQHKQAVRDSHSLCARLQCEYNFFPIGFIDRLVVLSAARHFEVDCSGSMAVMKGWGRTLVMSWREDEGKHMVIAVASTRQQIENLDKDLKRLEAFFPGVKRRSDKKGSGKEAVQVGIFSYGVKSGECACNIEGNMMNIYNAEKRCIDLTCTIYRCERQISDLTDNCLVNILCISTEFLDELEAKQGGGSFCERWNMLTTSKAVIIPVILKDYYHKHIEGPRRFNKWWPQRIQKMERYKVFHKYIKDDKVSMCMLYDSIIMKLHHGRGSFEDLLDVTSQNMLLCEDCLYQMSKSQDHSRGDEGVGTFDPSEVKRAIEDRRTGITTKQRGLDREDFIQREIMVNFIACSRGHKKLVKEMLEFNSSSSPCPSCLKQKTVPHFFSRPTCLSKLARDLAAKIECPTCGMHVDVFDVTPPQVFLSYQWGHKCSTQEMVKQVKRRIEEQTSLQCWLDVEGGINPGEDHMQKMELGVSRCEVFVVFMSDKYVKSANCRREFARACETGRYIIPVLVPVQFQPDQDSASGLESESGWKGDKRHQDWWKRISGIEQGEGAALEVEVNWRHFKSFPQTFELEAEMRGEKVLVKRGVQELVAAVQARAYRGSIVWHELKPVAWGASIARSCAEEKPEMEQRVHQEEEPESTPGGEDDFGEQDEGRYEKLNPMEELLGSGSTTLFKDRDRSKDYEISAGDGVTGDEKYALAEYQTKASSCCVVS
ncbi:hypothetical protein GUITHDRAFT_116126 [Guillardia theta CCMP2712]|uniref:non-specific serine/threonine protein kinase n=2 Tax=Guillardia theta TaxID=55529 RepID=L1IP31_GUITC|nr:hypothetical protein GUITHDRAFT_116126 [Guillardia theta CCMP2712]EKX37649.1 hypothetical protein GUITHDRAFT_116126 [Guillardia theta CCMP2712]|eukprot:XP_005824629.1 hypothetical protein GUITHDRAFT_116126 [Guillardia theta CCMP2712]